MPAISKHFSYPLVPYKDSTASPRAVDISSPWPQTFILKYPVSISGSVSDGSVSVTPFLIALSFYHSVFGSHSGLGYVNLTNVKRLSRLSFRFQLSAARWPTFTSANNGLSFCVFRFITVVFFMLFTTAKLIPSPKPHNTAFTVNLHTLPCWCPMLKPGNGVHNRLDGSILVGEYQCLNSIIHPKKVFDTLYQRIRKSISRGNQVILCVPKFRKLF